VAIEHELAALDAATRGCALLDLDATNAENTAVLVSPSGHALRLSASAAALVRAVRAGERPEVIAARFAAKPDVLEAAVVRLTVHLSAKLGALVQRRAPGFLAQRKLVSGARVGRWVRPLTPLFAPSAVAILLVVAGALLWLLDADIDHVQSSPFALWAGFAIGLALMFIHELGHASACLRYGAPVGDIGCALYLIYPAFFCDVTGTWALARRERVMVDLGGLYFQLVATALVAVLWHMTGLDMLASAVRISTATMVLNLLPLGRLDGYWVLSDILGVIDLRGQQRVVAVSLWGWLRGRPGPTMPWSRWTSLAIAGYSVASAWFLASIMLGLLPRVAREAALLPGRVGELVVALEAGEGRAALLAIAHLVSSALITWIALALSSALVRRALRAARGARRRPDQTNLRPQ